MQEQDKKYKLTILLILVVIVGIAFGLRFQLNKMAQTEKKAWQETEQEETYSLREKEKSEEVTKLTKQKLYSFEGKPEDNIHNQELDNVEIDLEFEGYDENAKEFEWLQGEDWRSFQKQLCNYLKNKKIEATKATLHSNSQQTHGQYVRYLYLDIDYKTEYSDVLLIKTTCDTYQGRLRFAFEIQYGD